MTPKVVPYKLKPTETALIIINGYMDHMSCHNQNIV